MPVSMHAKSYLTFYDKFYCLSSTKSYDNNGMGNAMMKSNGNGGN